MRFLPHKTYFVQNTPYDGVGWGFHRANVRRIEPIEYEAAIGAGELIKRKGIRILFKEAPDFGFLPPPACAKAFKREYRFTAHNLNGWRQS